MAAVLIEPTDVIECKFVPILLFGPPGCGKSSLAQTADAPLTFDFDRGIHRVFNRQGAVRFDAWADVVQLGEDAMMRSDVPSDPARAKLVQQFRDARTLVVDTGGRALDTMIPGILKENSKNGYQGNLSPQGWGVLGGRFTTWMKTVASWQKEVVMLCHQEEAKNAAGESYFLPDLPGKMSYKEMHKVFDIIGRIKYEGQKRVLDFRPSDHGIGKNAAGWDPMEIGELKASPRFLADLIADAKARIGAVSAASAEIARTVDEWRKLIASSSQPDDFNNLLKGAGELPRAAKAAVWALMVSAAKDKGLAWDAAAKAFAAAPNGSGERGAA